MTRANPICWPHIHLSISRSPNSIKDPSTWPGRPGLWFPSVVNMPYYPLYERSVSIRSSAFPACFLALFVSYLFRLGHKLSFACPSISHESPLKIYVVQASFILSDDGALGLRGNVLLADVVSSQPRRCPDLSISSTLVFRYLISLYFSIQIPFPVFYFLFTCDKCPQFPCLLVVFDFPL